MFIEFSMDVKQLNKLLTEIQNLHNAKLELAKELQSGQLQLEGVIRRREEINLVCNLKERDVKKSADELVLRAAKFFFASKPQFIPIQRESRPVSPCSPSRRAMSPPKKKPFLCGVSSPKKKENIDKSPRVNEAPVPRSKAAEELLDIRKEADYLIRTYFSK